MEQALRIRKGHWVVPFGRYQSLGAMAKPGKVIEADRDGVVVSFRHDGQNETHEAFAGEDAVGDLARVRWVRQGGRARWKLC